MNGMNITELAEGTEVVLIHFHDFSNTSQITKATVKRITKTRVTFLIREGYEKFYVVDKWGRVDKEVGKQSYRSDHVFLAGGYRHQVAEHNNELAKLMVAVKNAGRDLENMSSQWVNEESLSAAEAAIAALRAHVAKMPEVNE